MKVIDMRCRPAFLHDFFGATPGNAAYAAARWLNRRVGSHNDEHFTPSLTQQGFLDEVKRTGLSRAVVVGRHTPSQQLPNDLIHQIVHGHDSLLGIAAVDPASQGQQQAVDEAERAIKQLGLAGIDLEPGFGEPAHHADDPVYFPIYEVCAQLAVPVFLMSGPTTPDLRYNDPAPLARVAQAFPQLPIVCYHGFYPNVSQIVGVAFRYENVFVVPDMYLFLPGSQLYITAANGFMRDQLLFGSSYPFRPIDQSIEDLQKMGLQADVLDRVLYDNAARLFGLDDA